MDFKSISSLTIDKSALPVIRYTNGDWTWKDFMGSVKVRAGFAREKYKVDAGLYAFGKPGVNSDILVTANYKLTFDVVRKNLKGIDVWLLVLDTKGVNVWCVAGKGTFGTTELIKRIKETKLADVVKTRKLIVPQLGAVGIAAHKIKENTDFHVVYGPIRAQDIQPFIRDNYRATETMRTMYFPLKERIKLAPAELKLNYKFLIYGILLLTGLSGIEGLGFSLAKSVSNFWSIGILVTSAYISGTLLTPALLPWLPFRDFSTKGAFAGFLTWIVLALIWPFKADLNAISWFLIFVSLSSYIGMNFTGASTFTSLSGVKKEMKYALPLQIVLGIAGLGLFLVSNLLS